MYICYTNQVDDHRKVKIFSTFISNDYNFMIIFNIWLKLINKKNYAYIGGEKIKDENGVAHKIYFTNGFSNYFMEIKFTKKGEHELAQYKVEAIEELPSKELEYYTEPSIKCLQQFAACFVLPVLGIFDVHKEQNLDDVIEEYIKNTYLRDRRHFDFNEKNIGKEILTYLNLSSDLETRPGVLTYQGENIQREVSFVQFFSNDELFYFVQQANIYTINDEVIKIYSHYTTKEFGATKAMLDEYYFNNPESNYKKIIDSPLNEVLSDFYHKLVFVESIRRMGEE